MDDAECRKALSGAEARVSLREAHGPLVDAIPAVRRRMPGFCPYCDGLGAVPTHDFEATGETIECLRCLGSGDLDAARLLAAYECGRRDALVELGVVVAEARKVLEVGGEAIRSGDMSRMTAEQLRARVGGG